MYMYMLAYIVGAWASGDLYSLSQTPCTIKLYIHCRSRRRLCSIARLVEANGTRASGLVEFMFHRWKSTTFRVIYYYNLLGAALFG